MLRAALAAHVVHGVEVPANYSVLVEDHAAPGRAAFHVLYRGATPMVRTLDPHRLVEALFGYLGSHLDTADVRHLLLDAMALVGDAGAVLVPAGVRYLMPTLERRLQSKGVRVVDRPFVELDVDMGELVVDEPGLTIERSALCSLYGAISPPRRMDPPVSSGRYGLIGWGFGVGSALGQQISAGEAVTLACRQILRSAEAGPQHALDSLAVAARSVHRALLPIDSAEDLVGPLLALIDAGYGGRPR